MKTFTKSRRVRLREAAAVTGRVDRENGVVFGVRVCGWKSVNSHGVRGVNGTTYTEQALRDALPLYENAPVSADHLPRNKPNEERSVKDRVGFLRNARLTKNGVFADLVFLDPTESLAKRVLAAAEIMPSSFAMSHDATGEGDAIDGKYVVKQITEVRGVDLVSSGGVNSTLFESLSKGTDMADDYRDHLHMARKCCEDSGDLEMAQKIHNLTKPKVGDDDTEDENDNDGKGLEEDAMEDETTTRPAGYSGGTKGRGINDDDYNAVRERIRQNQESLKRPWTAANKRLRESRKVAKSVDEMVRVLRG